MTIYNRIGYEEDYETQLMREKKPLKIIPKMDSSQCTLSSFSLLTCSNRTLTIVLNGAVHTGNEKLSSAFEQKLISYHFIQMEDYREQTLTFALDN